MNLRCAPIVAAACLVVCLIGCQKSSELASRSTETATTLETFDASENSESDSSPAVAADSETIEIESVSKEPEATELESPVPESESVAIEPVSPERAPELEEADAPESDAPENESEADATLDADSEPQEDAPQSEPAYRILLPTTSGPLVIGVDILIGEEPLQAAFERRVETVIEEAADGSDDLTWEALFEHVSADPQTFGRSSSRVNAEQYRNIIQRYDRNRNKVPDHDEVTKFLFRDARFSGPFRLVGTDSYREINRSQSVVFAALDRNDDRRLDLDEIETATESLGRLDQNADGRLDFTEIAVAMEDDAQIWNKRRSTRWGEVAMDLAGYVDWSMLAYTIDEMPRAGPFGLKQNGIAKLVEDRDGSIDRELARNLLKLEPDLRIQVRYPAFGGGAAEIDITGVSADLQPLIRQSVSGDQIRIDGPSLRLIARAGGPRAAGNSIPLEAFMMLDANRDGGLDESEIPEQALREYSFEDLDQDGDEKLSLREINEGLSPKSPIWDVQVRARGAEVPDGVFTWMDENQDQFLSTREIHGVKERLRAIVSDTRSVKPTDIPDSYLLQFGRGEPNRDSEIFAFSRSDLRATGFASAAPRWAKSMDTNRDGEISRQEFPGTSGQFDVLDKNADGFVDFDEVSGL